MRSMRSRIVLGAGVFLAIVVAGVLAFAVSRFYTEFAWYRSLGQENVFVVRIASKTALWAAASVFAFLVLYINTRIAERLVDASRFTSRVVRALTAALAAFAGLSFAGHWMTFRLAVVQSPFGVTDPQFGKDVGFFVFTLPALELLATWANGLVVLSIICRAGDRPASRAARRDRGSCGTMVAAQDRPVGSRRLPDAVVGLQLLDLDLAPQHRLAQPVHRCVLHRRSYADSGAYDPRCHECGGRDHPLHNGTLAQVGPSRRRRSASGHSSRSHSVRYGRPSYRPTRWPPMRRPGSSPTSRATSR